jgi:3-methyladenine DNA glycosylase/8-oxoguanine DNA glycosylase
VDTTTEQHDPRLVGGRVLRFPLTVRPPYRLDRTVTVLQRLPSNPVDVWADGAYLRAFDGATGPVVWRVVQEPWRAALRVELFGDGAGPVGPWRARLRRMLGLDVDLSGFDAIVRHTPRLARLAWLTEGFRPPRFESLHEAFASVVLFQQVSLPSAIATLRRLVTALSAPVALDGTVLHPFPPAAALADAPDALFRAAGISGAKAHALRAAAAEIAAGRLDDAALAPLPTPALVERLRARPGVGPWTASLLALRYFGRLDVFPPGDVAAAKALGEIGSERLVERLGPWRGMLYYVLFARRMALAGAPAWAR